MMPKKPPRKLKGMTIRGRKRPGGKPKHVNPEKFRVKKKRK